MTGFYDNAINEYVPTPGAMTGHWYVDDDGLLYIIPRPDRADGIGESFGPDGSTMDALNTIYRELGDSRFDEADPEEIAQQLNLSTVHDSLRRFDTSAGYYSA